MGAFSRALAVAGVFLSLAASSAQSEPDRAGRRVLTYRSSAALKTLLARTHLRVTRRLPALHAIEVAGSTVGAPPVARHLANAPESTEPAVRDQYWVGVPYEWQFTATKANLVPESVLRGAAGIKIAVVDSSVRARTGVEAAGSRSPRRS